MPTRDRDPSLLWSAAAVVAQRARMLGPMAWNPSARRRREAVRMVTEKLEAALEGALAAQVAALREARSLWRGAVRGRLSRGALARSAHRILAAGGAPARRRLAANGRRLGRRVRR